MMPKFKIAKEKEKQEDTVEGLPGGCMFPCSLMEFTVFPLFLKNKLRCSQEDACSLVP